MISENDLKELFELMSLKYRDVDAYAKRKLEKLVADGVKDAVIIGGFIDYIGDSELVLCAICDVPVYVRPFVVKVMKEQGWKALCICCAWGDQLEAQLTVDLASMLEHKKRDERK